MLAILIALCPLLGPNAKAENVKEPNVGAAIIEEGAQQFKNIFQLKGGYKVTYRVTQDHPADVKGAEALEKSEPIPANSIDSANMALFDKRVKRVRDGYKSTSIYTLYASGSAKLAMEVASADDWNKGSIIKTYFNRDNIVEISPSAKTATIRSRDPGLHPEMLANFPALHGALGLVPDATKMLTHGKLVSFLIAKKTMPVVYLFNLDAKGMLMTSEKMDYGQRKLRRSSFQYSAHSDRWPCEIACDVFSSGGDILWHEDWELIGEERLPEGFDFNPAIDRTYRVCDMIGSVIPLDELNRLLKE